MSWQDDPIAEPASSKGAPGGGDWWKNDPVAASVVGHSGDAYSSSRGAPTSLRGRALPAGPEQTINNEVSLAARPLVGANRTIADTVGMPVDLYSNIIGKPFAKLATGREQRDLPGGSETVKQGMGLIGANPDSVRPASTTAEKVLEGIGSGAASMMVPGLGAEAILARSAQATESFGNLALNILKGSGTASNAAIGGLSGAGAEVAQEITPEPYKPVAALAGGLAGGLAGAGVSTAAGMAKNVAGNAIQAVVEPAELRAARQIAGRADQPQTFRANVAEAAEAPELVSGSKQTTFQTTGDLGVGGLEREVAASPSGVPAFAKQRQEQNAARQAELDRLGQALPDNADPANVAAYVQKRVQDLEQTFGERITAARTRLDESFRAGQLNEAEYGAALREAPVRLRNELEKIEDALWGAVDPDRQAPFNPNALKAGVDAIEKAIPRTAKTAEGEERAVLDVVKGLDNTTTFGDITALRSRLTDELREGTNTPTVQRRIGLMLKEVDTALGEAGAASPDVLDRYAAARAATRDVKTRFGEGNVGRVLKEGENNGFKMTASNVAKNVFDRPEDLRTYLTAVGDDPAALANLQDYAAFSLRKAAMRDGILSDSKYQKWVTDHDYVLKEFPDLAGKFSNVRAAQTALDDSIAAQKQALADYQTGAVKRLLNTQDPELVITNALKRPGEFEALAREVSGDPVAKDGMKRAVVDFMMKQAQSTAEAGTSEQAQINSATLQKFFLNNKRSLSALFDSEELTSIGNVAKDLQQANRSIAAVRIPGGSNTAQDTGSRLKSLLELAMKPAGTASGLAAGTATGNPLLAGAGLLVGAATDALRAARSNSIEKAVVEMMLDPKMASAWLAKVPENTGPSAAVTFARQLRAAAANQVTRAMDRETEGGR